MKSYSVKEISELLNTNPETVRRWIRSGKLIADQSSRKDGNVVSEDNLYKCLRSIAKYSVIATGMVAANPLLALPTVISAGFAGIIASIATDRKGKNAEQVQILSEEIRKTLINGIAESEAVISRKRAAIAELQAEIEKERQQIEDYRIALEQLPEIKE